MNRDFVEMLTALSAEGVEFLIVGAYAVAGHGLPRATGDIDLWVRPSRDNATKVWNATSCTRSACRRIESIFSRTSTA